MIYPTFYLKGRAAKLDVAAELIGFVFLRLDSYVQFRQANMRNYKDKKNFWVG